MTTMQAAAAAVEPAGYIAAKLEYETTPLELEQVLEHVPNQVFVVDIRSPAEFASGHIPTARNIEVENLSAAYDDLPRNIPLVIYCGDGSCGFSLRATFELAGAGFRVKRLLGGMESWRLNGYPVEATPPPADLEY
ncbi:MAG: rhodanese-like domain-containing protein [Elusimicrobiota bacterium]